MPPDEDEEGAEEEVEEEEQELEEEERIKLMPKRITIILFVLGIFIFIALVVIVLGTVQESVPGIYEACFEKLDATPRFSLENAVTSADDARDGLQEQLGADTAPDFLNRSIEFCGFAYRFNSSSGGYVVCEDGKIYEYKKSCRPTTILEKLKGLTDAVRDYLMGGKKQTVPPA